MPATNCNRCGKLGYATRATANTGAIAMGGHCLPTVEVDVLLCADCRGKAGRENTAARARRTKRV